MSSGQRTRSRLSGWKRVYCVAEIVLISVKEQKIDITWDRKRSLWLGGLHSITVFIVIYMGLIRRDPLSKPVLSFKPHIPKEVSNTILLLCGESSFTQWFWHAWPAPFITSLSHIHSRTHKYTRGNLRMTVQQTLFIIPHQTQLCNAAVQRLMSRELQFCSLSNLRKSLLFVVWWHDSHNPVVTGTEA